MRDYTVSMTLKEDNRYVQTTVFARNLADLKTKVEAFGVITAYVRRYNARGDHASAPWSYDEVEGWFKHVAIKSK